MFRIRTNLFLEMQDMLVQWSIVGRANRGGRTLDNGGNRRKFIERLNGLMTEMPSPEFDMCRRSAERTVQHLKDGVAPEQILHDVEELRGRILDQMDSVYFLALSTEEIGYFEALDPLFGSEVSDALAAASFDIDEAGKCLAVGRFTACVFHLMRVMELGVQQLGAKLQVKVDPKHETWHQILLHVNVAIDQLPRATRQEKAVKTAYAACSAHLSNVRIAWRNEVMHPKATYTEDEARDIFIHVRTFMRDLARLI